MTAAPRIACAAVISDCAEYRYRLTRQWAVGRCLGVILLNPSVADADHDDPTIRRCIGFAWRWGYAGITVGNLFALRTKDPLALCDHPDPVGPDNAVWLARLTEEHAHVLCGWGAGVPRRHLALIDPLMARLSRPGTRAICLGLTRSGQPRHPLYTAAATGPRPLPQAPRPGPRPVTVG